MATNSQAINVQFAGDDLGELVSVSLDGVQSDTVEITPRSRTLRDKQFRPADFDYGTISVVTRAPDALDISSMGEVGPLTVIKGASTVLYDFTDAMLMSLAWRASVGELQEYSATFRIGVVS